MIKDVDLSKDETVLKSVVEGIQKHCLKNDLEIHSFVNEDSNLPSLVTAVYKALPFVIRVVTNEEDVGVAVKNNIQYVRQYMSDNELV